MAKSIKDQVFIDTIKEKFTLTGFSDEEILKWPITKLRDEIKKAHSESGPYWRLLLRALRVNLINRYEETLREKGIDFTEVSVMEWPEALENPNSSAAESEIDEVADQIRVVLN